MQYQPVSSSTISISKATCFNVVPDNLKFTTVVYSDIDTYTLQINN